MSNTDVDFQAWDLQSRLYITGNIFLITKKVELTGKKEFAVAALDSEYKAFVVYIVAFNINSGNEIHLLKRAQITHLKMDKAPTKVLSKYADFTDVFSPKLAIELPKHIKINNHAIELVDNWQSPYGPIYSLG